MSGTTITMTGEELADLIQRMGKLKDQYFTVKEAAAYMRQRVCTIRGWIREGLIVAGCPTGGKLLVRKRDLDGVFKASRTTLGEDGPPALRRRAANARKAVEARKTRAAERRAAAEAAAQAGEPEPWMPPRAPAAENDVEEQAKEAEA